MKRNSISKSGFYIRTMLSLLTLVAGVVLALAAFGLYPGGFSFAQGKSRSDLSQPQVVPLVRASQDGDLRNLPYIAPNAEHEERRLMRHSRILPGANQSADAARAVRPSAQAIAMPTPAAIFPGMNSTQSGCGCLPPDTDGDVGPNHYVQSVNSSIKIFDKSGNALNGVNGTTYNTFFSPLGPTNPCGAGFNDGDGYVFYDHLADRWVVSDFAFPAFPGASFYQCIGVSQTGDPVSGGWYLYAIQVDPSNPTYLGDYPKFGLWPDGYYLTMNEFSNNTTFNGVRVYALDRNSMISGGPANAIGFSILPATLGDSYSLLAATVRPGSSLPPAGTPEYLMAINSSATAGTTETQVFTWRFHVDFVTPANSTFGVGATHAPNGTVTVNGFVDAFTAAGTLLVPQTGTTAKLDTLGDKLMTPLVYQNLGGAESLWASHTINNTGPTAIRWYQFNVTGSTIPATPAQQQTFDNGNDGLFRWMPSIAVDASGNMVLNYSTSSAGLNPAIKYAGRLATDPANTLAQGEALLIQGGGHQTSTSGRWGDYSMIDIDPSDNYTFWATNEYYSTSSSAGWNTEIGRFKFPIRFLSAASRMTHGGAGDFDIPLPLTGNPGIEDRSNGTGNYTIVLNFSGLVTSGSASVTSGAGNVSGVSFSGDSMIVSLTGVTNQQTMTLGLTNVTDNSGSTLPSASLNIGFLIGDTNADRTVNSADVSQAKSSSGAGTTAANFRSDVTADGTINSSDVSAVKARSGSGL